MNRVILLLCVIAVGCTSDKSQIDTELTYAVIRQSDDSAKHIGKRVAWRGVLVKMYTKVYSDGQRQQLMAFIAVPPDGKWSENDVFLVETNDIELKKNNIDLVIVDSEKSLSKADDFVTLVTGTVKEVRKQYSVGSYFPPRSISVPMLGDATIEK